MLPAWAVVGVAVMAVLSPAVAGANGEVWLLDFEDDFERPELGPDWSSTDAGMVNGRMLIGRKGPASAVLNRRYPTDVRIEFEAEAYEGRPPCDLSVSLATERLRGFSWNYLLAFGGVNNTVNKLTGGMRLKGTRDESPAMLIEPGQVYHMAASKEGKRLTLEVNGTLLLEGVDEEIMGGPGFEHVALVTWNGMYVDHFRAYRRKEPHPDTPRYVTRLEGLTLRVDEEGRMAAPDGAPDAIKEAVEAYGQGDLTAAEKRFLELGGEAQAAGLAYVYGNLDHDERSGDFPRVAQLFAELAKAHPGDQRLADYAWAASLFARVRVFPRDPLACSLLVNLGPENNPFYDKARLYQARFVRASAQEGGSREGLQQAQRIFEELLAKAPENIVLRQLCGERIPWGNGLTLEDAGVPRWAAVLRELYARQLAIMEWWFTKRQMADGQLGGGWGDDVEILRSWGPFAMISDASPAVRDGIERLCEGVWNHVLVDGFEGGMGDVEHSAEPSADTLPTMLAIRYGDPRWYERNLASCRRIRDYYTGIDANGYVRFKSGYIGGDRASENLQEGGDSYYSSRPMKHFFWPAWYGNEEAKRFYLSWVEGWVNATMTAKYTKLAGVPPGNIWYPSGDIAPPNGAPWNDPDYNIYGCCSIGNFWIQDTFLAGYFLSRDPYFLQPIHAWMSWHRTEGPDGTGQPPDMDKEPLAWAIWNAKASMWNTENTLTEYRWLTGDATYDEAFGKVRWTHRLNLPGSLDDFVKHAEGALAGLRVNFDLHTREVLQTDRAGLAGSKLSFAAYTGGVRPWGDAGVPTMAVTWEVPHSDYAALVVSAMDDHLRVWVYNCAGEATRMGIRLWRLRPGWYAVKTGRIGGGEGFNRRYHWGEPERFALRDRAGIYQLTVPSRQEFGVDLRLLEAFERPDTRADPAVGKHDVAAIEEAGGTLRITLEVHNLGSEAASDVAVVVMEEAGGEAREVVRQVIELLPACTNLKPSVVAVSFPGVPQRENLRVVVDPDQRIDEICESNNSVAVPGGL